ncbi:maleylpyruvate isomerase family mycothiol-dependent enzyme [Miniimonas arenae]|uniref:Maleylpyruvate isomerase family mycothiol-dependent enzyme n=1 Tax=Miniimonas arenae TaxID=676201 RepID=A0A5C5BEM2_9MICO|nr:maleylpyruvate isomerase family mycothiol-dependent enzyme [Miniimonas arenae]TNU77036.1 maleylpyruvate isomerase family mycothiol-dependent enzyme [Miniimonas arenae]
MSDAPTLDDDLTTGPRGTLVAALRGVPPTAPTLCTLWQARHLAAHVVMRERSPLRIAGATLRHRDAARERGDEVATLADYERLIEDVAAGPSRLLPTAWFPMTNVLEFHVHALDVVRAPAEDAAPAASAPVPLGPRTRAAIWRSVSGMARLRYGRPAPRGGVGVVLVVPGGPRAVVARGDASVVVTGEELELAMVVTGRERASLATLSGPDDAVAAFRAATGWDAPGSDAAAG